MLQESGEPIIEDLTTLSERELAEKANEFFYEIQGIDVEDLKSYLRVVSAKNSSTAEDIALAEASVREAENRIAELTAEQKKYIDELNGRNPVEKNN